MKKIGKSQCTNGFVTYGGVIKKLCKARYRPNSGGEEGYTNKFLMGKPTTSKTMKEAPGS